MYGLYETLIFQPIFNLLIAIYGAIPWGDFGVALIIFTVIVRMLLYPLVRRQLHQTKMMRKLQPQLKKIKAKHKGNRQAEAMEMMELYKKNGVSPFRSIGILLIQLPIFIALFHAIRVFTDNRDDISRLTYDFLKEFEPIRQLIDDPSQFNETMLGFIDLTKHAVGSHGVDIVLLLLALFAAGTQYVMSKQIMPHSDSDKKFGDLMREAAEGKQPDQSEMNAIVMRNMMKFMPVMLFFIMINLPGALALYFAISNLIAVLQQHYLLKQDEEELEELADEPTVVDVPNKSTKSTTKSSKSTKKSSKKSTKTSGANVTRITAKDTKKKRR